MNIAGQAVLCHKDFCLLLSSSLPLSVHGIYASLYVAPELNASETILLLLHRHVQF